MITFKQFLQESRSAPLYHGTSMMNLRSIIIDKIGIQPRTYHYSDKLLKDRYFTARQIHHGVSTSRNFDFAANYKPGVVLELDQRLLAQRYEIRPIQFWSGHNKARMKEFLGKTSRNEYEEFIITDKPIPVKYIKRIWVSSKYVNTSPFSSKNDKMLDEIRQEYGASFIRIHNRD